MKEYILTLVGVAVICGVVEMMSLSEGEIKNYLKLIGALCVLCVAISPIGTLLSTIRDGGMKEIFDKSEREVLKEQYAEVYLDSLGEEISEDIEERVEILLCERFDIDENDIDVAVFLDTAENDVKVSECRVILYPKAISKDPHKISDYIYDLLECECEIIYE